MYCTLLNDVAQYSEIVSGYAAAFATDNQKELAFNGYFTIATLNINAIQLESFHSLFINLMRDSWACTIIGMERLDDVIYCEICEDSFDYFLLMPSTSGHTICTSCLTIFDVCPICKISFTTGNIHDTFHIHRYYLTPNDNPVVYKNTLEIYNSNRTEEAVHYAMNYMLTHRESYKLLVLLSEMLYTLGDYKLSYLYATKAIELRKDTGKYSQAYYRRGLASFKLKNYKDALITIYKAMCISSPTLFCNYNEIKDTIISSLIGLFESSSLLPPCMRAKYLCADLERELRCWAQLPVHTSDFTNLLNFNWPGILYPIVGNIV